jgi:hypothetical protein
VTTRAMLEIVTGDRRSKHVGYSTTSPCKICACAVSSVSKDPCTLPAILETFVGTLFLLLHFSASIEVKHRTKPLEGCEPEGCSFETYFQLSELEYSRSSTDILDLCQRQTRTKLQECTDRIYADGRPGACCRAECRAESRDPTDG